MAGRPLRSIAPASFAPPPEGIIPGLAKRIQTISLENPPKAADTIIKNAGLQPEFADIKNRIPTY